MTKRFDINLVRKIVESEGYTLVSDHYLNSSSKINLLCPKKHGWEVTLNNFRSQGQRCPSCSDKINYNLSTVKELLAKEGYTLITPIYENMHQKLETRCPKDHIFITSLTNYVGNKSRCTICRGVNKYTIEKIRNILKEEKYELITDFYKNSHQKLEVICPNKHRTFITLNGFISGNMRCGQCSPNRPYPSNFIKEFVEKRGYQLVSESYGGSKKLELICPNGHLYNTTTFYNFRKGRSCPECSDKGTSKVEKEILKWIKQFYPSADKSKFKYDSKNGKKYLEIDIYIPELKLGIEYNGLIWHSEKYKKNNYHIDKMKLANSLGIRVINIFGDEWRDREKQIKNHLLSVMNKTSTKIGARKTEIKNINKKEAEIFLEENHIQGSTTIGVAFGLYYKNELLGVITGNKHHRQGQDDCFVLNRLAFKNDTSVQGGSSKLLKALIFYAKDKKYSKLISWSDNRWSEGRVYEKMGFQLEDNMDQDYSYVKREDRLSKQSCQKKNLIKKGAKGTMLNTEKELALSLGLYRIWDCGKKRWGMDLTK